MKNKKQFVTLGLFVILTTTAMIVIALWLSFGISKNNTNTYISIFHEPVDGLSVNSSVLYNGVNVGKVQSIQLDHNNPGNIYVNLAINDGTPITKHTFAILQQQGITGLSYVSLQTPKKKLDGPIELLKPTHKPPYPIIETRLSLISSITDKVQELSTSVNTIATKVNHILSKENTQHFNNILKNTDTISQNLIASSKLTTKLIQSATNITTQFEKDYGKVNEILNNINTTTKKIDLASNQIFSLTSTISKQTLPNINDILIPKLNNTLTNFEVVSTNLNQLISELSQNPSMLIKGRLPPKPGPGE